MTIRTREFSPTIALDQHDQVTAANGCDQPCPYGTFYHCCIVAGPHDGAHFCDQGHSF